MPYQPLPKLVGQIHCKVSHCLELGDTAHLALNVLHQARDQLALPLALWAFELVCIVGRRAHVRVQSAQCDKRVVAEIALVGNAVECALCRIVGYDAGRPAFYAARGRNRGHYPECVRYRSYLLSRETVAGPRFNVKCD